MYAVRGRIDMTAVISARRGQLSTLPSRVVAHNLVSMTRLRSRSGSSATSRPGYWLLQDAKARFSELVRKVRSEGPQHVTVHGRDEVVVIAAEDLRRLKGDRTGRDLIKALQASPRRDVELAPARGKMPVRSVVV